MICRLGVTEGETCEQSLRPKDKSVFLELGNRNEPISLETDAGKSLPSDFRVKRNPEIPLSPIQTTTSRDKLGSNG